jgi:hypothetical protein
MIVYAESSAVLSWLFGEPPGGEVRGTLEAAEFVVTSDLTVCTRGGWKPSPLGDAFRRLGVR